MSDIRNRAIELAQQPYTVSVFRDKVDEGEYVYMAINPEIEGCAAQGETPEEAQEFLDEVRIDHIEHLLEHNLPIPVPQFLVSQTAGASVLYEKSETVKNMDDILNDVIQPSYRDLMFEVQFMPLQ